MRLLPRRFMVLTFALVMTMAGAFAVTGSAASASPRFNTVNQTAFIWNCPTGAAGCSAVQTRVGDIRTSDPMTDVCRVNNNELNLAYNRTNRTGAAKRTGFLYRSNLTNPTLQTDSCTGGGVGASAPVGTEQRLCPFLACGGVAESKSGQTLRAFCFVDNDSTRFFLITAFISTTGGPLTAGFMDQDDMNSAPGGLLNCETLFG